ncbi:glycoside hydrolase family 2 protein [Luteimicrobium xylanilyticum]|uniref:glycoside hydrolase family 2 protein n=1 Tax=Luteimicrobium xylanilyticum TaxID=1133546 RepID=UPI0031F1862C
MAGPVATEVSGRSFPATVPGSVHTDLLAAGAIPDPYLDDNEALLQWIGQCDWEYRTTFDWVPDGRTDRHELVFDGLDTVATVVLNGAEVARTANMHRTYRFDVADRLRQGANELVVTFASPVRYADAQSLALGYRPQVNHHPFNAIRKMACSFGWDWGIDTASSGIWRPVRLESWRTARLASVRPVSTVSAGPDDSAVGATGHLDVHVALDRATTEAEVVVTVAVGAPGDATTVSVTVPAGASDVVVPVDVADVDLWWPRGYGAQPLYEVTVEVRPEGGIVLDRWTGRVGFRTVRLDTLPDEQGTSFTFVVNDQPVWVKGANWIPDDAFPHRVTRDRYAARIAQAEAANVNLLRVWGGGIYEADDFYDLCDERGVLTWQDFLFACAAYSEDDPLRSEVEAEARDNVTRLMVHPSLVLWNGSNENVWGVRVWGFERRLQGRSWGLGYYEDLLPSVVGELDPGRPYTPSSPWSGDLPIDMGLDPNSPDHGSMHSWELWNREDYPHYRDDVPRFMAEFGWQGPPAWSTLTRAIHDDPLTPESPGMLVHQKAMSGNDKLTDGLVAHLPLPDDMGDWHWAMSLNQANAVQLAVEHLRSWAPRNMGSVVWQLNDCWPVTSWAAVDGDGHAKPLLHALAHAHADRLVTVQPRDGGLAVVVVNDTAEPWRGDVVVQRLTFDGVEADATKVAVDVAARGTATVPVPEAVATPGDERAELLVATLGEQRGLWFFAEARDSALEAPRLRAQAVGDGDGWRVTVTADNLVRDVALLADIVDPSLEATDALVTLLPGETVTFDVRVRDAGFVPGAALPRTASRGRTAVAIDPSELTGPRVLRSANDLVARWVR